METKSAKEILEEKEAKSNAPIELLKKNAEMKRVKVLYDTGEIGYMKEPIAKKMEKSGKLEILPEGSMKKKFAELDRKTEETSKRIAELKLKAEEERKANRRNH